MKKKFSIKKQNFIANVGIFLPVWLFSRSDAIWAISQFRGCQGYNKILGLRLNSQVPPQAAQVRVTRERVIINY